MVKKRGFKAVISIRDILLNRTPKNNLEIKYTPKELTCMKYAIAPITSVDVDRSLCHYKTMLRSNHHHIKLKIFKLCVISNCFSRRQFE